MMRLTDFPDAAKEVVAKYGMTVEPRVAVLDWVYLGLAVSLVLAGFLVAFGVRWALPLAIGSAAGLWSDFGLTMLSEMGFDVVGAFGLWHSIGFTWFMAAIQGLVSVSLAYLWLRAGTQVFAVQSRPRDDAAAPSEP